MNRIQITKTHQPGNREVNHNFVYTSTIPSIGWHIELEAGQHHRVVKVVLPMPNADGIAALVTVEHSPS